MRRLTPRHWAGIAWVGTAIVLMALVAVRLLGDRWWGALPLLYGPRYVIGAVLLLPLAVTLARPRTGWKALLSGIAAFALLLDLRLGLSFPRSDTGSPLRVVSFNAQGGGGAAEAIRSELLGLGADVIVIAECSTALGDAFAALPYIHIRRHAGLCVVTPKPLIAWEPRDPSDLWQAAGSGAITRGTMVTESGDSVVIGGVHLETPRDALEALAKLALRSFPGADAENRALRRVESQLARTWIVRDDDLPVIVAGDFNLTVESAIYRAWWGDLTNAFSARGRGLGWTKRTRLFGTRIDHILVSPTVRVTKAWVGPELGSDHRPVIADLIIPPR